ncbi:MAG: sulfatase-like hydrolase/transferase [Myxococcota bacterium]
MLLLMMLTGCTIKPAPQKPKPPNVLLVTMDTLRADALPMYGNTVSQAPVLRQFASESTRFSRAFSVTPLTIPAHSSIFTGLYPPRHGVRDNGDFFLSDDALTLAERMKAAGYQTMAAVGAEVTSHHWGFSQGFDDFFDDMGASREEESNRWRVERRGDLVINDAIGWFNERDGPAPWFAWVHLFDAHHPYEAPEAYARQYPAQPYLAEVNYVDFQIGRLLADLEKNKQLDETLIVILSDHGEGLGSHGEALHGVLLYNATTRIPLFIRPPGGQVAEHIEHFPVSHVDMVPTILDFVGLPTPEDIDGISLRPWVGADALADKPERNVYVESLYAWRHYGWAPQRALIAPGHKLIDSTTPELYTRQDVLEVTDLAQDEPARVSDLQGQIQSLAATMTPMDALSSQAALSPERIAQLEAMGYITTEAQTAGEGFGEQLPDPVARLPVLAEVERGRHALAAGDLDEAREAIEEVIAAEPGLTEPRMMLSQIHLRQGELKQGVKILEDLHADRPSSNVKIVLGNAWMRVHRTEEGLQLFREAIALDPYLVSAWTSYLNGLFLTRDPSLPLELDAARERLPDLDLIGILDGILAFERGDMATAEPLIRLALDNDSSFPGLRHALGVILNNRGEADAAESLWLDEVSLHPPALNARRMLITVYASQKRYEEQHAQLLVVHEHHPEEALTLHALAQAAFNLQRYDEALARTDTCLAVTPNNPHCMLLKANALSKLGQDARAREIFERAQALARGAP